VELPKGMLIAWEHSGIRRVSRVQILALGGLFITTPNPPPVGDTIRILFEIPGGDVRARALIRDSQPGKGMGIEFTAMGQEARARLNRLMKVLSRY
jgi:PilZ domain